MTNFGGGTTFGAFIVALIGIVLLKIGLDRGSWWFIVPGIVLMVFSFFVFDFERDGR